jgi:thiamine biosynthesis lipoprotein
MKHVKTILYISITLLTFFSCKQKEVEKAARLQKVVVEGKTQGTTYHITYLDADGRDFQEEINEQLAAIDKSLSIYDSLSLISRINRNDSTVVVDSIFKTVFRKAQEISIKTKGAFDITVGPLMRLWGFNKGNKKPVTDEMIDSVKLNVGYKKVKLIHKKIVKENRSIHLDVNGIAQGYSCDLIGNLLESKGISNYMVEIGGEMMCMGHNPSGKAWKLGICEPINDSTGSINKLRDTICVKNVGVSTSGNYRKFHYQNGQKINHQIDPRTGYPTKNNLLSVTVIAPNCMTADAYATAFMVMGVVRSIHLLQKLPNIDAYFIYRDRNGKTKEIYTRGFWKYLEKKPFKKEK